MLFLLNGYATQRVRHLEYRVTSHIRFNSRQVAERVFTRCHIRCSFRSHLPVEMGSGATTCPAALGLISLLS
jgi:hypothetical protein